MRFTSGIFSSINFNRIPVASSLSISTGNTYDLLYTYSDPDGDIESLSRPEVFELQIVGTFNVNTSHSISKRFFQNNAKTESGSLTKWYIANDYSGTSETIVSTGATYTPLVVDKYLRVSYKPSIANSVYGVEIFTDRYVIKSTFKFSDIAWYTLHQPTGATNISTNTYWINNGLGTNSTVDTNSPTWDATEQALRFTSASSQRLLWDLPSTALSRPVELWMRVKFATVNAAMDLVRFTNSHGMSLVNGGGVRASMSSGSVDTFSANTWYVFRFVVMPNANESIYNRGNGTVLNTSVPANTGSFSTADGRIGASYSGAANYFNGWISHIMMKQGALSAPEELNMWNKFATI